MNLTELIQTALIYALPVLFAITVSEAAQGYVAHHFGDTTAAAQGRLTFNPLAHIDLLGTIVIPLVLYFISAGHVLFGYAKPLQLQMGRLRNPKRDMIWVSLAGPGSNLLQGTLWGILAYLLAGLHVEERFFVEMAQAGVQVNVLLFAFLLFPLPPLPGGRILMGLLPWKQAVLLSRIEPWGFFIVMGLMLTGVFGALWLGPLTSIAMTLINLVLWPLTLLF